MGRLDVEVRDGIASLTLNRPDAMNALNDELKTELAEWLRAARYDTGIRAVLLAGAGRAFCAGGDLTEMEPGRTTEQARARQDKLVTEVFVPLARLPKPVVAAVHSHAHGAGLSLALACDIVVAAADAPMSLGFVHRGLAPDCGILHFLPRLIGTARAKELLLTGRRFSGAEAASMGMVAAAVPADEVRPTAQRLVADLASGASIALGQTKTLLDRSWSMTLEQLGELEAYASAVARSTGDHAEALSAFAAKRAASFAGS
jgi:2-(1,2-epoxy-1,2-dihydrophenyl)acetyl-CoA isomerase